MAVVALAIRSLAMKLRETGEWKEALVANLEQSSLQAEDILQNIRSGVITVDVNGRLLYANPISAALLGFNIDARLGQPILESIGAAEALREAASPFPSPSIRSARAVQDGRRAGDVAE